MIKQKAELISTGAELLNGRTLNRHGQVLGSILKSMGVELTRDTTIVDDLDGIAQAVASALERVDMVFITGGLGPTSDDCTRQGIAKALGRDLVMDQESYDIMAEKYAGHGQDFTESRKLQALIVDGAAALQNPAGMAPGEHLEVNGKQIFVLPGPPREFLAVMQFGVDPILRDLLGVGTIPDERIFMTVGLGESDVAELMQTNSIPPKGIEIAYYSGPGVVEVVLRSDPNNPDMDEVCHQMRQLLGKNLLCEERMTLEQVVFEKLKVAGKTAAVAESCTGGLLGAKITGLSGSSAIFLGGIISYSNEVKVSQLGVDPAALETEGAVSEKVAKQMAEGVRRATGADYGISITGVAGPDGGTAEKPVGLVYIGVSSEAGVEAFENHFSGDRLMVRERSANKALDRLRLTLEA